MSEPPDSNIVWAEANLLKDVLANLRNRYDEDQLEIVLDQIVPLRVLYAEEFQRYWDLFIKYFPRKPCHVKRAYERGFVCIKGRKKGGEQFDIPCYPDLVAQMLDYDRWECLHPSKYHNRHCWIALREPRKSRLNAIDFDNKPHLLGYYRTGSYDDHPYFRPLTTMPLAHFKAIKRIYDEFPNRIWCISSATLGLHLWEVRSTPQDVQAIQIMMKTRLHKIGLGTTEVHPMLGRAFRRPFGQDYYTITNNGLLNNWVQQLDFFDKPHTPSFESIYKALRSLLDRELGSYYNRVHAEVKGINHRKDIRRLRKDLSQADEWAQRGFPSDATTMEPVVLDIDQMRRTLPAPAERGESGDRTTPATPCDINMSQVCNGEWVQHCALWARNGLPCHDSIFIVCSNLARWLYFIELYHLPEQERVQRISALLTTYCKTKHNGYITRWDAGMHRAVIGHIKRAIDSAIKNATGLLAFTMIRQKRDTGQYQRVIYLEDYIENKAVEAVQIITSTTQTHGNSSSSSLSCCAYICCSDFEDTSQLNKSLWTAYEANHTLDGPGEARPEIEERRSRAEAWVYKPDCTPIPELEERIRAFYKKNGLRLFAKTVRKLTAFIRQLAAYGGEARLGIESLSKMGFTDHAARKHINRLDELGIMHASDDYCPAAARSKHYKLTKTAMAVLAKEKAVKTA